MKIKGIHAAPALMIVVVALFAGANFIDVSKISGAMNPYMTVTVLQLVCLGLPAVFFCLLRGKNYKGRLHLNIIRVRHITAMAYALFIMICIGIGLGVGMYWLFPEAFASSATTSLEASVSAAGRYDRIYSVICFCALPALLEEFLIRGVVMAEYAPWGAGISVLFSSLLFAMLHFSPVRFPIYLLCGVVLALLAEMTGSLIATSIVHILYNIFTMYFETYIYKIASKSTGGLVLLVFIVVCILLLSLIFFFGRGKKLFRYMAEDREAPPLRRQRVRGEAPYILSALLSPTFLILLVFYIILSFIL